MEEPGEELIDLNENNIKEKENKSNKEEKNKKKDNKFIYILLLIIIAIIIFLIYLYVNKQIKYKSVIIFDFDKTIIEKDAFEEQRYILPSKEEQDEYVRRMYSNENWALVMSDYYNQFYNLNVTISEINNYIDKVEYTPGMIDLFHFLKKKEDKYILIIISAGHSYQIERILQRNNLTSFFDEIIAFNSYIKDGKIIVNQSNEYKCDVCLEIGICKTNEFNILKEKYKEKNIIFDKIFYICDGVNDYCLAKNLEKNDELLIRKDHGLDKYLYKEGFVKNIKSNIYKWNSGFDIIKYFNNLK